VVQIKGAPTLELSTLFHHNSRPLSSILVIKLYLCIPFTTSSRMYSVSTTYILVGAALTGFEALKLVAADTIPDSVTAAGVDLLDASPKSLFSCHLPRFLAHLASDILHFLDVVDAYGHVSVRNPANSSQFLMFVIFTSHKKSYCAHCWSVPRTYAVAPAQATSQSIVTYVCSP
jgi:hypothetical protein